VSVNVQELAAVEPITSDAVIAPNESALLTAIGENMEWYDAAANGLLLATGANFQTPVLDQSTTYYVESHSQYPGEIQYGGKADNSGAGALPSQGSYNYFNAWEEFTIVNVTVYVPVTAPSGLRTIRLYDGNEVLLDENVFDLGPGTHELTLNFEVPVGNNYSLRCVENNLFRNTSANTQFPYPIGTVGEITNDALGNEYYYYFYNWKVQKKSYECISDRVPVTVKVVSPSNEVSKEVCKITLTPNPASSLVMVDIEGVAKASSLKIYDGLGREVMQMALANNHGNLLQVEGLSAGIYLVKIQTDLGTQTAKLVIQ
jgi:hypothetical protein